MKESGASYSLAKSSKAFKATRAPDWKSQFAVIYYDSFYSQQPRKLFFFFNTKVP